jgi:membrane protease YdiL (CAAX protease family)
MAQSENYWEKTPGIKNEWVYFAIPAIAIAFAEILMLLRMEKEALIVHAVVLLGLSFFMIYIRSEEIQKTYLALILLPILRLINLSIPVFYDTTLYSLIFIYGLLSIPASIAATHQEFSRIQLGITFKRIWIYAPLSIILGLLIAEGEYLIIRADSLIPDLSAFNLLILSIVMIFFVGLVEEIIFRSIIQNRLQTMFGDWPGLIFTSILFGLMHSGYGSIYELIYASLIGFLIGYLFYKTRSLPFVVMFHGFINIFLFGVIPRLI